MSSESSAEESLSEEDDHLVLKRSVMKVKKIVWLKKKYRDGFHQIDTAYYGAHKKSRDKLKKRVQGRNSSRPQPSNCPRFAVKSEFRNPDDGSPSVELNLNDSASLLNTSTESTTMN